MRPRSHVAPFIVQMGRQFAQVTQLGGGRAETQPGLPVLTPRSAVTCPSLWGICLGQVWEEGDRKDCFSLEGTVLFWAARRRGRRGSAGPQSRRDLGSHIEGGRGGKGFQGPEHHSWEGGRPSFLPPGVMTGAGLQAAAEGAAEVALAAMVTLILPATSSPGSSPDLAPALPTGGSGHSPCLAACDEAEWGEEGKGKMGLCVDMGEEMG